MTVIVLAGLISFVVALLVGPGLIKRLRRLKLGQNIQKELPKDFQAKQGTPIMGGLIILIAVAVASLWFARGSTLIPWLLFLTLGNGLIGLVDDFIIVTSRRSIGLKARQKLMGQIVLAVIVAVYAYMNPRIGSSILVPWGNGELDLGLLFIPFVSLLVIVGTSTGVNLTDGMDGLAAGTSGIAAAALAIVMFIAGYRDLAVFAAALVGGCLGFAWFNAHPAQVFMGDTGSLALGAGIAGLTVLSRTEFYLIPIGGIFLIQVLCDVIQVGSYKLRKKRVFRMAPIHFHFHLGGLSETKVVFRFWIVGLVLSMVGVSIFALSR